MIRTLAELKTEVSTALTTDRKAASYDRYLALAEETIFERLRVREMVKRGTISLLNGKATLIGDALPVAIISAVIGAFSSAFSSAFSGGGGPQVQLSQPTGDDNNVLAVERVEDPKNLKRRFIWTDANRIFDYDDFVFSQASDADVFFSLDFDRLIVRPAPVDGTELQVTYYLRPTGLSDANPTNSIFPRPGQAVYYYALLWQAYADMRDGVRAGENLNLMLGAIDSANKTAQKAQQGGGPISMPSLVQV